MEKFIKFSHRVVYHFFNHPRFMLENSACPPVFLGTIFISYNCYYEKTGSEVKNITDEIPFDIPDSWCWTRLGNLITIISGVSYDKKDVCNNGIRILRGGNVNDLKITTFPEDVFLPEKYYDTDKQVRKNDIIVVASTGSKTVIGKAGYVDIDIFNTQIGAFLRIVRPLLGLIAPYLKLIFATEYYREHIRTQSQGTNINNVKAEYITEFRIPFPPLAEQERIVAEIEKFEPLIAEYDKLEQLATKLDGEIYDKLKKSILQYAIQGKLVPQDSNDEPAAVLLERIRAEKKAQLGKKYVESYIYKGDDNCYYEHINGKDVDITEGIPFDLPIGWAWERLCNITEIIGDGIHGTPNFDDNGKYYFINGNNLVDGKVVLKDATKKVNENEFLLHRKPLTLNTILLSINGTLGNIAYYNNEPIILGKSACYISLSKNISKEYARVVFETKSFLNYAAHSATKTTIANISLNAIRTFLFPLPPLAEQKRIVEKIDEIFAKL